MGVMNNIIEKAKSCKKTIVLPESTDLRMLEASQKIVSKGIANIILLGDEKAIKEKAGSIDLSGVTIIDPLKFDKADSYADELVELRKHRGMTKEKAEETIKDPLYFGCMMVKLGDADGMVAGAVSSTPDVWRPVLQIIKTRPGISVASSCFLMEVPDCDYGENGVFIYADCSEPDPTAEQLASIASSADRRILMTWSLGWLCYLSLQGSASHESVDKVVEATRIAKEMAPDLLIDGELQVDAALDSKIGQQKSPGSPVAGKANVLIFPDLGAGNIAYKLTERLAKAMALGPLSQGLAKPVNDLSRGCSSDDIVNVVAITALEAQNN